MGRLIDADALIEEIKSLQVFVTGLRAGKGVLNEYAKQYRESLLRIVYEQSTVYDISKVVAELDESFFQVEQIVDEDGYKYKVIKVVPLEMAVNAVRRQTE